LSSKLREEHCSTTEEKQGEGGKAPSSTTTPPPPAPSSFRTWVKKDKLVKFQQFGVGEQKDRVGVTHNGIPWWSSLQFRSHSSLLEQYLTMEPWWSGTLQYNSAMAYIKRNTCGEGYEFLTRETWWSGTSQGLFWWDILPHNEIHK